MLEDLARFIEEERLLQPDAPVVLGVSGGADSMAALQGLKELGVPIVCAHFNHHMRQQSERDSEFVRAAAEKVGVPFVLGDGDVPAFRAAEGLSMEEAARLMRYRFLFRVARVTGAQAVATAHNAGDQVETVLMHFLRGTGLSGLSGIRPKTFLREFEEDIPLVRPFLRIGRAAILAFCAERGIEFLEDPSNADLTFYRNRLRHDLLPELETYQPAIREVLLRNARVLALEDSALSELLDERWGDLLVRKNRLYIGLSTEKFSGLPKGLQARALRRAVSALHPALRDLDFESVRRGLRTAAGAAGSACDLTGGLQLMVEDGVLWIAAGWDVLPTDAWPQVPPGESEPVPLPGEVALGEGWYLEATRAGQWDLEAVGADILLLPDVFAGERLALRGKRRGERFLPKGMGGHSVRLSDFMINEKIPKRARARWPLLVSGDRVLWVVGRRAAEGLAPSKEGKFLRLRLLRR